MNIWMKKLIKKEKQLLSEISGKGVLEILTGEAENVYKKKNQRHNNKNKEYIFTN